MPNSRSRLIRTTVVVVAGASIALGLLVSTPVQAQTTTTIAPLVLSAPQVVQAQQVRDDEIRVSWLPPQLASQPIQSYRVQILSNSADAIPATNLLTVNGSTTSVNFRKLKYERTYFFTVQAQSANIISEVSQPSNTVELPNPANLRPNPPTNVVATQIGTEQASVSWLPPIAKPGVEIKGYRLTTSPSSRKTDVGLVGSTLISGLKPGVAYVVLVQAIPKSGSLSDTATSGVILVPPKIVPVTQPPVTLPPATLAPTTLATTTTILPLPSPIEVPALKAASRCTSRAWNPSLLGAPRQLAAGAPAGVYIWTDGRAIHLRTYNPSVTPIRISGSVSGQTTLPTVAFYLEPDSDSVSKGRTSTSFSFLNAYDIDSLRFDGRCITKLTVRLFLNGQPFPTNQIFIGGNGINPTTSAFVLSR